MMAPRTGLGQRRTWGVRRECLLAKIEQAIAEEHPELDRGEVFELVEEWLRAVRGVVPSENMVYALSRCCSQPAGIFIGGRIGRRCGSEASGQMGEDFADRDEFGLNSPELRVGASLGPPP